MDIYLSPIKMQQRNLSKPEKFGHEKGHTAHEHLSQLQKNYFSKKLFGDFFNCFFFILDIC